MTASSKWPRLKSHLLIFAGPLCLVAFVFFLLYDNYRTSNELQRTLVERLRAEALRHASEADHYLDERKNDLKGLADSDEIKGFFSSLAQGISKEYGLAASRIPIQNLFNHLLNQRPLDGRQVYTRLLLLDAEGEVLVEVPRRWNDETNAPNFRPLLAPKHKVPTPVFSGPAPGGARFSLAYNYGTNYAGQILAWVDLEALFREASPTEAPDQPLVFLDTKTERILPQRWRAGLPADDLSVFDPSSNGPLTVDLHLAGQHQRLTAFRLPLTAQPFDIIVAFKAATPTARVAPVISMTLLAVAIMGGAFLILFYNTRSLLLKVRLDESVLRQKEIEDKNRLLETEIQERQRVQAALSTSEQNYREIFNATEDGILVHEAESGRILDGNQAILAMLGYEREELVGLAPADINAGEAAFTAENAFAKIWQARLEGPQLLEWKLRRKNGETFWVEVALKSSRIRGQGCVLAVLRDITERKRADAERQSLQEQLAQTQKIESIGRLAGGVAHDFNNVLAVVLGNLDYVLSTPTAQAVEVREPLLDTQQAAQRAADLTRQLLAFSRKQMLQVRRLDLNESILGFASLLQRLLGDEIDIKTVLHPALGLVRADPVQVEQVILNLAVNARDAMPQGGTLTIETAPITFDLAYASSHTDVKPGPYVLMTVSDTGTGMDEATQRKVFEPFFTTKEVGKGTGLGLATVFGIVKQHGGHVSFASTLGHGTTFRIYLPRAEEVEEETPVLPAGGGGLSGTATILLVEDDSAIRFLTRRMLVASGYKVLDAAEGAQAILLAGTPTPIDLLITDVVMPHMSGREVYEKVAQLRPGLKVLYTSGYLDDVIAQQGILHAGLHFLQKPFSAEDLAAKVSAVLKS